MARGQLVQRPVEPPAANFIVTGLVGDIATFDFTSLVEPATPDFTPGTYLVDVTDDGGGAGTGAKATVVVASANGDGTQGGITKMNNQSTNDWYEVGTHAATFTGAIDGGAATADVVAAGSGIFTVTNISAAADHSSGIYYDVVLGGGTGTGAEATVTVAGGGNGAISSVVITKPGTGYLVADAGLTIDNARIGGAADATVDVDTLAGQVSTITMTAPGADYDVGETLTIVMPPAKTSSKARYNGTLTYVAGDIILPTSANAGNYYFRFTTRVGAGGAIEPVAWGQVVGGTTLDAENNIWTNIGATNGVFDTADVFTLDGSISSVVIDPANRGIDFVIGDTVLIADADIGGDTSDAEIDVLTLYGSVATVDVDQTGGENWLVGDVLSASELDATLGVGTGLQLIVATLGIDDTIATVTVSAAGSGYEVNDTVDYIGAGEIGVTSTDYYNHHQYELGGTIEEYVDTGAGLTVSYTATTGVASVLAVGVGGTGYTVGDKFFVTADPLVSGIVTTVNTGVVTGVTLVDTVTIEGDGAVGATATTLVTKNAVAPAGAQVHANADNDPSITVVVPADTAQLKIQKRTVGGVTIYAEPTTLDGNGQTVGNTLRAEDILDEDRCVASGFIWTKTTAVTGNRAAFGYCTESITFANTLREEPCTRGGFFVDRAVTQGNAGCCVQMTTAATWRTYVDTKYNGGSPSAADVTRYGEIYGINWVEALCRKGGQYWNGSNCIAIPSGATFLAYNQADCATNKGVWIGGRCYAPTTFGNGNGGNYNHKSKTYVVKAL